MQLIKVNFHSAVDIITNSSTTIFTYSEGCDRKALELIDEFIKVLGSDKKAEDMFYIGVFCSISDYMEKVYDLDENSEDDLDIPDGLLEGNYKESGAIVEETFLKVMKGEIGRPEWMIAVDESTNYMEYNYDSSLYIVPKEEKYKELGEKIRDFLYSTDHDGCYN